MSKIAIFFQPRPHRNVVRFYCRIWSRTSAQRSESSNRAAARKTREPQSHSATRYRAGGSTTAGARTRLTCEGRGGEHDRVAHRHRARGIAGTAGAAASGRQWKERLIESACSSTVRRHQERSTGAPIAWLPGGTTRNSFNKNTLLICPPLQSLICWPGVGESRLDQSAVLNQGFITDLRRSSNIRPIRSLLHRFPAQNRLFDPRTVLWHVLSVVLWEPGVWWRYLSTVAQVNASSIGASRTVCTLALTPEHPA